MDFPKLFQLDLQLFTKTSFQVYLWLLHSQAP